MLRTQWTEMVGYLDNNQYRYKGEKPRCGEMELNALECLESYGWSRGERYCKDYMDDFSECVSQRKTMRRIMLMRRERIRQTVNGDRKPSEYWGYLPNRDSYIRNSFQP